MARTPRVYNGCFFLKGVQVHGVMAGTQKQIAAATKTSLSYIREYWSETGNADTIKAARDNPEKLLWRPLNNYNATAKDYHVVE